MLLGENESFVIVHFPKRKVANITANHGQRAFARAD